MQLRNQIIKKWLLIIITIFCTFFLIFNHKNSNIYSLPQENIQSQNSFLNKMKKCISTDNNEENVYLPNYDYNIFHYKPSYKLNNQGKIETMYNYNKEAQLLEKKCLSDNKNYEYIYNVKNQIIAKKIQGNQNFINTYEYNDKNQLIIARDSNNKIHTQYEYNDKGQLKRKINFLLPNTPFAYKSIFTYKYNNKNQKINTIYHSIIREKKILKFIDQYKKINRVEYTYEYNDKGQKIKKTDRDGNIFTYKYYDLIAEIIPYAQNNN